MQPSNVDDRRATVEFSTAQVACIYRVDDVLALATISERPGTRNGKVDGEGQREKGRRMHRGREGKGKKETQISFSLMSLATVQLD